MIPVRFTQILRCSRFSSCTGLLGVLFLALLVRLVAVLTLSTPNTEPSFQGSIAHNRHQDAINSLEEALKIDQVSGVKAEQRNIPPQWQERSRLLYELAAETAGKVK